ncbi:MAG: 1,4-dihydroxy-2-naphthoate octaprenyltransferase [Thermaerobacter sp.]|nr:1,4-dihydroxy-2-naphthoate octaprenyltransferase [Thermaerobacter sp.]
MMTFAQLVRVSRPPTLAATVVPILVGAAVAWISGKFSWWSWLDMIAIGFAMQIGANMLNEYFDFQKGLDGEESQGIGGIIVSGEVPAKTVWHGALICYGIALGLGLILVATHGPWLLVMGLLAILAGFVYAGGPLPLSSTPFGEIIVFFVMGPLEVTATSLATSGVITSLAWFASLPVGLLVASILLANNLRDRTKDAAFGRHTIPIVLGSRTGFAILVGFIGLAYATVLFLVLSHRMPVSAGLVLASIPLAVKSVRAMRTEPGLRRGVPIVGRLHVVMGFLLTLGILWNVHG